MSKYEPRATTIKEAFARVNCKVSWANRRGRLMLTVKPMAKEDDLPYTYTLNNLVSAFYKDAYMTSYGLDAVFNVGTVTN